MTLEHRLFARNLRLAPTGAQRRLWQRLRGRHVDNAHFRRQHPIGEVFADFCCTDRKLVIEVNGIQHSESDHDLKCDEWLRARGYTILRFWNNDVLIRTANVVEQTLATVIELRSSRPPP